MHLRNASVNFERKKNNFESFVHTVFLATYSGVKYVDNKMPKRFQNFPVCLGNTSAKKLPKTQQKPMYTTSAMASSYLDILPRTMICFFNS